jgi:hypothetical protein
LVHGVGDGARHQEWDSGLRCNAGYQIAFKINGKRTGVAPSAPLVRFSRKDDVRPQHRALKGTNFVGDGGHTALKPLVGLPALPIRNDIRRDDHIASSQMRRKSAGDAKTHQAIRPGHRPLHESGCAPPIAAADHDRKTHCARDPSFGGQTRDKEHRRQPVHIRSPSSRDRAA